MPAVAQAASQLLEYLVIVALFSSFLKARFRKLGRIAHRQRLEGNIIIRGLQATGGRQDDVGVPGSFVDVNIYRGVSHLDNQTYPLSHRYAVNRYHIHRSTALIVLVHRYF